jgi:hypothetical protein
VYQQAYKALSEFYGGIPLLYSDREVTKVASAGGIDRDEKLWSIDQRYRRPVTV